jgi:hypothetical protein
MTSAGEPATTLATTTPPDPKPWREWEIDDLGVTPKIKNVLLKNGIETYAQLAEKLEEDHEFWQTDMTAVTCQMLKDVIYRVRKDAGEILWPLWRVSDFVTPPGDVERKLAQHYETWGEVAEAIRLWIDSETNPLELTEGQIQDLQGEIDEAAALQGEAEQERGEEQEEAEKPIQVTGYQPTAEELAEYNRKTNELVLQKLQIVRAEERNWKSLHAEASAAKKSFESAQSELNDFIEQREMQRLNGRQLTIDDIKPEADSPLPLPEDLTQDLWQQYPMTFERWERFGLTKSDIEKLNSGETKNHGVHPILVFGDITRFITPNPANPGYARTLKDFKGLGEKGYDRYQEAETKFWTWWNNKGMAEFAAEKGITNGPATLPGNDGPGGSESQPDDASEPVETPARDNPDIDPADVDTDAPKTPSGKRSRRKKQTA